MVLIFSYTYQGNMQTLYYVYYGCVIDALHRLCFSHALIPSICGSIDILYICFLLLQRRRVVSDPFVLTSPWAVACILAHTGVQFVTAWMQGGFP